MAFCSSGYPQQSELELTCFNGELIPETLYRTVECRGRTCGPLIRSTDNQNRMNAHYNTSTHPDFGTILNGPLSFYTFTCRAGYRYPPNTAEDPNSLSRNA